MMFSRKPNDAQKPSEVYIEDTMTKDHKLEAGADYSGAVAKTDEKEIALVKKLDIRIMGILWAMYFLVSQTKWFLVFPLVRMTKSKFNFIVSSMTTDNYQNYLDRNAIAQARLNDLEEDLGLVGDQYNTCISILFVG
jgi:hypothetical protein